MSETAAPAAAAPPAAPAPVPADAQVSPMGPAEASGPPPPIRSRTPSDGPPRQDPRSPQAPPSPTRAPSPAARDADGPPAKSGGWFDRFFGRPSSRADAEARSGSPPAADDAPTAEAARAPEAGSAPGQAAQTPPAAPAASAAPLPPKVQQAYDLVAGLSFEEQAALAARDGPFQRLAQGFVDKATARAAKQQADQSRLAQVQQLAEQERALRDTDPLQSAALRNQLDQYASQQQALTEVWQMHDRVAIDPALARLDEATAQQLRASVGPGLEGRQAMVEAALDAYRAKVVAETEARLRKDPRFAKQVLAQARGGYLPDVPPEDEPEVFTNGVSHRSQGNTNDRMNAWLRAGPR